MSSPERRRHRQPTGRVTVVSLAVLVVLALAVSVMLAHPFARPDAAVGTPIAGPPASPVSVRGGTTAPYGARWLRVLGGLDTRRAAAWRAGDPSLLSSVYVPGSPQLAADQAMLRGYQRRGLSVTGVHVSYFVLEAHRMPDGDESVLVVDRLGPAVAHDQSGAVRALPVDEPTRHLIVLRRVGSDWRIARISLA